MPGGRPRKDDAEKKKRGTYRPSRANARTTPGTLILSAKPSLPISKEAMTIFDDIAQVLISRNALEAGDIHLITLLALEYEAYYQVYNKDSVQTNDQGISQPSGHQKVKHQCLANIARYSQMLRVVPVSRGGIKPNRGSDDDDKPKDPMKGYI